MSNWADELRLLVKHIDKDAVYKGALEQVDIGERQLEHALNTVECLVEANAALREQLCALKMERGVDRGRNSAANFQEPKK